MEIINLINEIPFNENEKIIFRLRDENDLLLAVVNLTTGQTIPQHHANAKISIFVLRGSIQANINTSQRLLIPGDMLTLEEGSKMEFVNSSEENATLILVKSPNPGLSKN